MLKVHFKIILVCMTYSLVGSATTKIDQTKAVEEMGGKAMADKTEGKNSMDLLSIMSKCNETFRIEMSYLRALNESGSFPDETDKTPKCYLRCILKESGVASEDGEIFPSQAAIVFAGERGGKDMELEELATNCTKDRKETCKCEMAYQFMKCLMESEILKYE